MKKKFAAFYYHSSFVICLWTFLALTGCMILSSSAFADQDGDYTYTVSGGNATITGYTGAGGAISIPATLGGYPTVAIGDYAFSNNSTLTSVIIPGSVKTIGIEAFRLCDKITSLTIPEGVTSIGYRGCARMYALTSVTIPASVTSIGTYGFFGGISNTGITVHPDNPNYSSLNGVLYNKNKTALIQYPCGKGGAFTTPASVTSIGIAAFELCSVVTSVTLTGSVTSLANEVFVSCTGLTSVIIGNNVTSIGDGAFYGCTGLTGAYFYGNAPAMGDYVFDGCEIGFTVYYLAGATGFTNPWYGYPTAVFTPTGSLALIQPNGGESWNRNSQRAITWNANGCQGTLKLTLWQNGGLIGTIVDGVNPAAGSYSWIAGNYIGGTAPLGTGYSIKIEDNGSMLEDSSDAPFSIVKISVKAPNGGESWQIGSTQNITWVAKSISGQVRIVLFKNGVKVGNIVNSIDPALGTYAWTVGNYVGGTATAGTGYQVQVREIGTDAGDRSDANFTLTAP